MKKLCVYQRMEFIARYLNFTNLKIFYFLLNQFGFKGIFKGAAISITEMKHLENRFDAISDQRLSNEQRDFLSALTFNNKGVPLIQGDVAGIDACYLFSKT